MVQFGRVSVVIPHLGKLSRLKKLLNTLVSKYDSIHEIIVVLSAKSRPCLAETANALHQKYIYSDKSLQIKDLIYKGLDVKIIRSKEILYPGHARNIGIQFANSSIIGLLDSNTIPCKSWPANALLAMDSRNCDFVLGSTRYTSNSFLGKIILASTYGFKPLITIHGALFKKESMIFIGGFLPNVRAAEDIDFIGRARCLSRNIYTPQCPQVTYGLQTANPFFYLFKWYRNYSLSAPYPSLGLQSFSVYLILVSILISLAFIWNSRIADWNTASFWYIPNITKIVVFIFGTLYGFLRGYYMPSIKMSFGKNRCSICFIPIILAMSSALDLAKSLGLLSRSIKALLILSKKQNPTH